ncbi:MAG: PHP domain-containing protein [Gemmataceae bacterium]|nr:PHP domain-containing protein [Gemmataceae bacterium]
MKRNPFTALCQQASRPGTRVRADLHVHTTASDGDYTPSQVAALAKQAGLAAVAVTDHDTTAGVAEAVEAAAGLPGWNRVEVIAGVEITTEMDGREFHLLAYFVDPGHAELSAVLARMCERRRKRFRDYLAKLADRGTPITADRAAPVEARSPSLGRRHVAGLLVACGFARSRNEAFGRLLAPLKGSILPKEKLPIADAIALVHAAGGVASLAHPPADLTDDELDRLAAAGLDAVESEYAWGRSSPAGRLRRAADRLGLVVTGGSDCHGPDPAHRRVGSYGLTADGLERLRGRRPVQHLP